MLHIGPRTYQLVRAQSGFHVMLNPDAHPSQQQVWRLDAHFIPDDEDAGPELNADWEYWRLVINPLGAFRTSDWRELNQDMVKDGEGAGDGLFLGDIENLIGQGPRRNTSREINLDDFCMTHRNGYLFTCEMRGDILNRNEDGAAVTPMEFRLLDEIPLATTQVKVPLNAADPLDAAHRIAAKEIGLTEIVRSHVRHFDPERKFLKPADNGHHTVTLETPWRASMA